jgi:hypothetical protein
MAVEKWVGGSGQGLTWGSAFASSGLDGLSSVNAIASTIAITNGTALDIFADVSVALPSAAFAAPNYLGVYIYPLDQDSSSYGDNRYSTAAAGPPPGQYWVGNIGLVPATQAQVGSLTRIILPPGTFKFVIYNQGAVALSTGNTCAYRTYNRSVA